MTEASGKTRTNEELMALIDESRRKILAELGIEWKPKEPGGSNAH